MKEYLIYLTIVWIGIIICNILVKIFDLECKSYYSAYSLIIGIIYTIISTIYNFM